MFWKLLSAHIITDFVLQTGNIAENKKNLKNNFLHCSIFVIVSFLFILNELTFSNILIILLISVLHGLIDFSKAVISGKFTEVSEWIFFSADQLLHFASIIVILVLLNSRYHSIFQSGINGILSTADLYKKLFFFLMITFGGSYFTAAVCKNFTPAENERNSLASAGRYIGILERIIVFASILIGRFEIIGFLIAAKSIIRHNGTKTKAFTEYFLIGTFTSFLWAAGFTYLFLRI